MSLPTIPKPRIVFIGSNPSIQSQSDFAFFMDTQSGKTLRGWTEGLYAEFLYTNVSSIKTENNRPLTKTEINEALPCLRESIKSNGPCKLVALGKTAHTALTLLRLDHLEMPHPSGLNRKLNDPEYKAQKIKELAAFCTASPNLDKV